MSECVFYKTETKRLIDQQKRPTASIVLLPPITIKWCAHPNSALRKDEKGELECDGEIGKIPNCPISSRSK